MLLSLIMSLHRCFALFSGPISDKIGRRNVIRALTGGLFIVSGITQLLLQFVSMTVDAK
jgi:MFS family permease